MTQSLGWFHEGTPGKEAYLGTCLPLATACSWHLAGLASTPQDACHTWQVSGSEAESWFLFSLLHSWQRPELCSLAWDVGAARCLDPSVLSLNSHFIIYVLGHRVFILTVFQHF